MTSFVQAQTTSTVCLFETDSIVSFFFLVPLNLIILKCVLKQDMPYVDRVDGTYCNKLFLAFFFSGELL